MDGYSPSQPQEHTSGFGKYQAGFLLLLLRGPRSCPTVRGVSGSTSVALWSGENERGLVGSRDKDLGLVTVKVERVDSGLVKA